jgi:membrane fusion protein, multidrug efflux system
MKKIGLILVVLMACIGTGVYYCGSTTATSNTTQGGAAARGGMMGGPGMGGPGMGGPGGPGGGGGGPRMPMTVEIASVGRADVSTSIVVVGNLIGEATVEALPKVGGRLQAVYVRLGDRVSRNQPVAKIEDQEIQEQVKQAQASFGVSEATVRQREADLRFANTNQERSRNLFERQLLSRSSMDDAESRAQAAAAQLDLARAQYDQAKARLEELQINLANTVIRSPVDGFVGKRNLDPGAWVATNSSFISVVDIRTVRLVANVIERDLRRVAAGLAAKVQVDAFPGEIFAGHVARVAPVLDPATRTAQIEVEVANQDYRLKPGMYARIELVVEQHPGALVVPTRALVVVQNQQGVWVPGEGNMPAFKPVTTGIEQGEVTEIAQGLSDGDRIITTGAGALRQGDRYVLPGQDAAAVQAGARGTGQAQGRGTGQGQGQGRGTGQGQGQNRGAGRTGGAAPGAPSAQRTQ